MQHNRFLASLSWLILVPLAGCAHDVPTTVDVTGMPNPEIAMRESIAHVDSERAELGRMRPVPREAPPVVPAELDRVVAFAWEGPLDGAVEKLAGVIGYSVAVAAPTNAVPLPIGISTGPKRVYEIFEAIGASVGNQATVQIDPQHHRIEVIHHV
jgi:defect-in-organelle-trafficking protein DotD